MCSLCVDLPSDHIEFLFSKVRAASMNRNPCAGDLLRILGWIAAGEAAEMWLSAAVDIRGINAGDAADGGDDDPSDCDSGLEDGDDPVFSPAEVNDAMADSPRPQRPNCRPIRQRCGR